MSPAGRELGALGGLERAASLDRVLARRRTIIATGGADGIVRLWDARHSRAARFAASTSGASRSPSRPTADTWRRRTRTATWSSGTRESAVSSACSRGIATGSAGSSSRPMAARWPRPARTRPSSSGACPRAGRRRGRPCKGDLTPVWSVAYSPDGKILAVADGPIDTPGTVTLWDVADAEGQGDARRSRAGRRHGRVLARRQRVAGLRRLGRHDPDLGCPDRRAAACDGRPERRLRPGVLARWPAAGLGRRGEHRHALGCRDRHGRNPADRLPLARPVRRLLARRPAAGDRRRRRRQPARRRR